MRLALNVASAIAYIISAVFWWRASHQPPPSFAALTYGGELDQGFQGWVRSSARANQRAALCTGIAASLQAIASIIR